MPKVIEAEEKFLRMYYEKLRGKEVSSSTWCKVKKIIADAGLALNQVNLFNLVVSRTVGNIPSKPPINKSVKDFRFLKQEVETLLNNLGNDKAIRGDVFLKYCSKLCLDFTGCKLNKNTIYTLFERTNKLPRFSGDVELKCELKFCLFGFYDGIDLKYFFVLFIPWLKSRAMNYTYEAVDSKGSLVLNILSNSLTEEQA